MQGTSMILPTLQDGEYISKVIVVPMGTDGQTEGEWAPETSFRLIYRITGNNNTWPDGTPATGKAVSIPMQ